MDSPGGGGRAVEFTSKDPGGVQSLQAKLIILFRTSQAIFIGHEMGPMIGRNQTSSKSMVIFRAFPKNSMMIPVQLVTFFSANRLFLGHKPLQLKEEGLCRWNAWKRISMCRSPEIRRGRYLHQAYKVSTCFWDFLNWKDEWSDFERVKVSENLPNFWCFFHWCFHWCWTRMVL